MTEISGELAALRQEVVQLRAQVEATDDWAQGVHVALTLALQVLMKDHPQAPKLHKMLKVAEERYEDLRRDPSLADEGETAAQFESPKMLNRQLGLLGIWPDVDPHAYAYQLSMQEQP